MDFYNTSVHSVRSVISWISGIITRKFGNIRVMIPDYLFTSWYHYSEVQKFPGYNTQTSTDFPEIATKDLIS